MFIHVIMMLAYVIAIENMHICGNHHCLPSHNLSVLNWSCTQCWHIM